LTTAKKIRLTVTTFVLYQVNKLAACFRPYCTCAHPKEDAKRESRNENTNLDMIVKGNEKEI